MRVLKKIAGIQRDGQMGIPLGNVMLWCIAVIGMYWVFAGIAFAAIYFLGRLANTGILP